MAGSPFPCGIGNLAMNKNVLGGTAALLALGAIIYFASQPAHVAPPVVNPAPVAVKPVVAPPLKPVVAPAPKPEIKIEPKAKPVAVEPHFKFYRVEQGGKQGAAVECRDVKPLTDDGKSPAELATLAKQYGVTESDLKRYFICTN